MKRKITLVLLLAVFVLGLGCTEEFPILEQQCDPNDQGGPKMKVEYDYQEAYEIGWIEGLYDNVKGAFKFAGTDIEICGDSSFLPDDPNFFTPDGLLMIATLEPFFSAHKTSNLVYYLASARGLYENQGAQDKIWGATKPYPQPNVPPNPKWSFIFVGDIPEENYGDRMTKHRHVTYATIHELGHQRAGLTHPEQYPQYHHETYPCIMYTGYNVTSGVLSTMGFCYDPTSEDNCRYFLRQQNQR